MPSEEVLESEQDIVWIRDPEDMEYVRIRVMNTQSHEGKPPWRGVGEMVGYTVLSSDAPTLLRGRYRRRVFYLKEHDRPNGGDVFEKRVPAEGVDPLTLEPGELGEVTERALGVK